MVYSRIELIRFCSQLTEVFVLLIGVPIGVLTGLLTGLLAGLTIFGLVTRWGTAVLALRGDSVGLEDGMGR